MKRLIALALIVILALSCTACSWNQGDIKAQTNSLDEYIKNNYGEYEVLSSKSMVLDTATMFRLKDKLDGFEYSVAAMEVYLSDLGFSAEHDADAKTIVMEDFFLTAYMEHLLTQKVDGEKFSKDLDEMKENDAKVVVRDIEATAANVFTAVTTEISFVMKELNVDQVKIMASHFADVDERDFLKYMIVPIYITKDNAEPKDPTYFYSFYLDYVFTEKEYAGVSMLIDYALGVGCKDVRINSIELEKSSKNVTPKQGFSWLETDAYGTFIKCTVEGKSYEFYTAMGARAFDTDHNDFGIYKGSFLDVMSVTNPGSHVLLYSVYATMYPKAFHIMDLHFVEAGSTQVAPEEVPNE